MTKSNSQKSTSHMVLNVEMVNLSFCKSGTNVPTISTSIPRCLEGLLSCTARRGKQQKGSGLEGRRPAVIQRWHYFLHRRPRRTRGKMTKMFGPLSLGNCTFHVGMRCALPRPGLSSMQTVGQWARGCRPPSRPTTRRLQAVKQGDDDAVIITREKSDCGRSLWPGAKRGRGPTNLPEGLSRKQRLPWGAPRCVELGVGDAGEAPAPRWRPWKPGWVLRALSQGQWKPSSAFRQVAC